MKKKFKYIVENGNGYYSGFWRRLSSGVSKSFEESFVYSKDVFDECNQTSSIPKQLTLDLIFEKFPSISSLTNGGKCPKNVKLSFTLKSKGDRKGKDLLIYFKIKRLDGNATSFSIDAVAYTFCSEFTKWIKYNNGKVEWFQ